MGATLILLTALAGAGTASPGPVGPGASAIIGGEPVDGGRWPDAAGLVYSGGVVACAGTLIAPDLVVTAAHCLDDRPTHVALDTPALDRPGPIIEVLGSWRAPEGLDAAVLLLAEAVEIAPRPIALGCAAADLTAGATATVVGYGAIDRQGTDWESELRAARVTIVDPSCGDAALGCRPDLPPASELVAGGGGRDACRGDSGGPLYLHTAHGDYLAGVVSRAVTSGELCGDGGIYVRADALVPLIEEAFGRRLATPMCAAAGEQPDELVGGCQATGTGASSATLLVAALLFGRRRRGWRPTRVA